MCSFSVKEFKGLSFCVAPSTTNTYSPRFSPGKPSDKRKDAGLDYRYALIVNDESYIELQTEKKIPESQYRKIKSDYDTIKAEFTIYVNGYVKAAKKNRVEKEPLYRESCLVNFKKELL